MNVNSYLSPRLMAGAAIVGLVGAAGVFIYEQVYAEKKRLLLVNEVARLDKQVASMRSELQSLRDLQKEAQLRRQEHRVARQRRKAKSRPAGDAAADAPDGPNPNYTSDSEYYTDYQSVGGTDVDMDSEEFYDVHTDEDSDDDTLQERSGGSRRSLDEDPSEKADTPKQSPRDSPGK